MDEESTEHLFRQAPWKLLPEVSSKHGSAFNMGCEGVTPNKKDSKKRLLLGAPLAAWSHLTLPENKGPQALDRTQSQRGQLWRWQAASPLRTIPSFIPANRQKKRGVKVMYSVSSNTDPHRCSSPISPGRRFALNPASPPNPQCGQGCWPHHPWPHLWMGQPDILQEKQPWISSALPTRLV